MAAIGSESENRATYVSVSIGPDTPMGTLNDLMKKLRESDILGVSYTSADQAQKFYPISF